MTLKTFLFKLWLAIKLTCLVILKKKAIHKCMSISTYFSILVSMDLLSYLETWNAFVRQLHPSVVHHQFASVSHIFNFIFFRIKICHRKRNHINYGQWIYYSKIYLSQFCKEMWSENNLLFYSKELRLNDIDI